MTIPVCLSREPAARFAAFRVMLGVVLLADAAHLYSHRGLFAEDGPGPVPLGLALPLWMAVLCTFVAGVCTRAAALANYLCAVSLLGRPSAFSQVAGDSILISLSLLAVFFPCGASVSLDRWVLHTAGPRRTFAAARWALAAYLSTVYVDSGLRKLHSPLWRAGLGVVAPAGLPSLVWTDTSWLELLPAPVLRLGGWGVIGFELLFPALYAWRRTRTAAVLTGILLHLGIAVIYPFPIFSGLMVAIYAGLLPERCYAPLQRLDAWAAMRLQTRPRGRVRPHWPRLHVRWRLASYAAVVWLLLSVGTYAADRTPDSVLGRAWDRMGPVIFATTGILNHGVFDDSLFCDYRYQVRLVNVRASSTTPTMPYARDGLFAWSVRDRVWEHWWKRTQAPWVSPREARTRLACWATFYWPPTSGPQEIRIEVRPQAAALDGVDPARFRKNSEAPWRHLGTIRLAPGTTPELTWAQPPDPQEKRMGDFILRVLNRGPTKDHPRGL
jgi:hypothetical protein